MRGYYDDHDPMDPDVQATSDATRLEVRDVERVTAWARERCPSAVVERVTVHVDKTGEIPDGAELPNERDSFSAKPPKERT